MRAARTPPEPPPMTNRSTSNSAIGEPQRSDSTCVVILDFLAALLHLGAELAVDGFGKLLRPLIHVGHAELDGPGLVPQDLLAERRLVEGDQILQLLLGELVGVDLCHAVADFLLAASEILGNNHG